MSDQSHLFPGKTFISTVLDALDTKTEMSGGLARVYLMRAAMAGVLIGVMYLTYFAVIDGRIDNLTAQQGNSVPAGGSLATLTGGDRYVEADFRLVPRDYARVVEGATARIILPNDQVVTGTVGQISVASGSDGTVSTLRIAAPSLLGLTQASLAEPGAPVMGAT